MRAKRNIRVLVVISCVLAGVAAGASSCGDSCEDARTAMKREIDDVCREMAYTQSPFCTCCVPSGFYSVDDQCRCAPLTFDEGTCFYATNDDKEDQAKPQVRNAIDYANGICQGKTPTLPYGDAAPPAICPVSSGGVTKGAGGSGSGATGTAGGPAGTGGGGAAGGSP